MTPEELERNRDLQAQVYGEPLGDLLRRIAEALGLTQARLAETVGLSAPMLSQLIRAQRVKIGNPAVVARIQTLGQLAEQVRERGLDPAELDRRLAEVQGASGVLTSTAQAAAVPVEPRAAVREVQDVLRAVASADELLAAATAIEQRHPGIAEVLRLYGAGRTDDAVAHYRRVNGG